MREVESSTSTARKEADTLGAASVRRAAGVSGDGLFRNRLAVCTAALWLALAGCSSGERPALKPDPSPPTSAVASTTSPAWSDAFSADELAAYKAALTKYTAYLNESESIWASGKATPRAQALFRKYYIPWQAYWEQLQRFEQSNVRIARNANVLDSRATRVELRSEDAAVTIQQCVDATRIGATQDGKPLANAFETPQLVDIEMSLVDGRWYITQPPTDPKDRPCDA